MLTRFRQIKKDLFAADFVIEQQNSQVGSAHLQGSMFTMGGDWTGTVFSRSLTIDRMARRKVDWQGQVFRPSALTVNASRCGQVFQTSEGNPLFGGYEYHKLLLAGQAYEAFPIGMGEEGYKTPIYRNGSQIALIEKGTLVLDDLHIYEITSPDEESAFIACIFCCYMYTLGPYKPGEKAVHAKKKSIIQTKNEALLAKYDPSFKMSYSD